MSVGFYDLLGGILGGSTGGIATSPPTLAFSSATTSTIVLTHTIPPEAIYSHSIIYIGLKGVASHANTTVSTTTNVTFTGLNSGTEYWFVAYADSVGGPNSIPSNVVIAKTLAGAVVDTNQRIVVPINRRAFTFAPYIEGRGTSLAIEVNAIEFEPIPIRGRI